MHWFLWTFLHCTVVHRRPDAACSCRLLFICCCLWAFCCGIFFYLLPSALYVWFASYCTALIFILSMWRRRAFENQETYAKASALHFSSGCLPVNHKHAGERRSLFGILTLHLSGSTTLCLDINIYWRRNHPSPSCRSPGGRKWSPTSNEGAGILPLNCFFLPFFLIGKGSGDSWGSAGFKEVRSWVLDSHKWRGVWPEGAKGGKNAEENRLVGVTCRGGFIAVETVNAPLERHSRSWSGKSMLQAHELNCLITGVKNFTVI